MKRNNLPVYPEKAGSKIYMERNKITVNGKPLTQLETELAEYLPMRMLQYTEDGYAYFPVEAYENRFIEVVGGRRWFNIATTPPVVSRVNNRFLISLTVRIEIMSDSNETVWACEAAGGSNVIIVNKTGEAKDLKSGVKSATSEALKNVYQMFGIGITQLRSIKSGSSKAAAPPAPNINHTTGGSGLERNSQAPKDKTESILAGQTFHIMFLSRLNSISAGYAADIQMVETGEKCRLIIFHRYTDAIKKYCPMATFVETYKKGTKLHLIGYENFYNGQKQIVFKQPIPKGPSA